MRACTQHQRNARRNSETHQQVRPLAHLRAASCIENTTNMIAPTLPPLVLELLRLTTPTDGKPVQFATSWGSHAYAKVSASTTRTGWQSFQSCECSTNDSASFVFATLCYGNDWCEFELVSGTRSRLLVFGYCDGPRARQLIHYTSFSCTRIVE